MPSLDQAVLINIDQCCAHNFGEGQVNCVSATDVNIELSDVEVADDFWNYDQRYMLVGRSDDYMGPAFGDNGRVRGLNQGIVVTLRFGSIVGLGDV